MDFLRLITTGAHCRNIGLYGSRYAYPPEAVVAGRMPHRVTGQILYFFSNPSLDMMPRSLSFEIGLTM
jgi:hypothetical protein